MIRDEDGQLTGYVYIDLKDTDYGGFVDTATRQAAQAKLATARGLYLQVVGRIRI